jgi:proline dehydrogenase
VIRAVSKVLWSSWQVLEKYAGRAYVAGPKLDDALQTCRRISNLGFASTICFWNLDSEAPQQVANAYSSALAAIGSETLDCYLSIKLPPLKFDRNLLNEVLKHGGQKNMLVHFDSLEPEAADKTFSVMEAIVRAYPRLGCTLPGRWLRSCSDADWAVDLGVRVRVVKGQWQDSKHPYINLQEGYLNVIDRLAGRAKCVAVATHDPALARESLERLRKSGTPCSLELLYGLPVNPVLKVARQLGVPVRVYVPYGYGWLPYSLTQAKRNPRVFWWVLRDLLSGGSPLYRGSTSTGLLPPVGPHGRSSS